MPVVSWLLVACAGNDAAWLIGYPALVLEPEATDLVAPYGTPVAVAVEVANPGGAPLEVTLELAADPAWALDRTALALPAASSEAVTAWFTPPPDAAPHPATLRAEGDRLAAEVELVGRTDPDGDGDGHDHEALGGDDCDDADPAVHPGATEAWYDGVDQDCDGWDDYDADGDGWRAVPWGDDCDDADPAVHPGATEAWYDGVDQDCDGWDDDDQDRDGHAAAWRGGDDCDDTDPLVHPGATEAWYDGVDQDCDGWDDDDQDRDGHAAASRGGDDCDDTDPSVAPGLPEIDDGVDQDCDGLADEGFLAPGDVVVSELMVHPLAGDPVLGAYVEVVVAAASPRDTAGWILALGDEEVVLPPSGPLPTGTRFLLCGSDDPLVNGGLACLGAWGLGAALGEGERVALSADGVLLDEVRPAGWTFPQGASLSLDPAAEDALQNDLAGNWCPATSPMAGGDLGTPGLPNDPCP